MTLAEKALWSELHKRGLHLRRQAPIGPYIADFAQHSAKLVVEIDGFHHSLPGRPERDAARDAWLSSQGYRVLRFSDRDVLADAAAVALIVMDAVRSPPSPALPPSRGKGV